MRKKRRYLYNSLFQALVCAFLSAVISWSFKFPLQLRFILQLSHACSPILKSSPTRKSFGNDIFDISDSVTSSCLVSFSGLSSVMCNTCNKAPVEHLGIFRLDFFKRFITVFENSGAKLCSKSIRDLDGWLKIFRSFDTFCPGLTLCQVKLRNSQSNIS